MATKEELARQRVIELCGSDDPDIIASTLRELKEEEIYRLETEKYRYFEPNGKGEEFIKAVGELNENGEYNFIVLFSAANGVGKTVTSANIVANILFGEDSDNKWFDMPLFKNFPYPKKGRIISDPENIKTNLIPTLEEWLPKGRYTRKKLGKQYYSSWKTDNGHSFDIMSYEQSPKEFESITLGWAWFDEPPTQAIFKATVSRMRKGGIIFISETPLYAAWLYDHIVANPDKNLASKGQRVYIEAGVEAACKQHGVRGHLEHRDIERMIAEYSEDEQQARIHGKFQHLVGLRFKQFDRKIHVVRPFEIRPEEFCVYHSLDTHPRVNDAGIWIAVDKQGRKFVVNEFWKKCLGGTEEMAQDLKNINSQYRIMRKLLEPAAFIEDQHTDKSLAKKLESYGLNYLPATKKRAMSDTRIEDAFAFQKVVSGDLDEFIKAPELYIFDTCGRTIFEIEHYRWDDWTGKSAENKGLKEKTVDKDDHMIESIGRIMIQEPVFIPIPEFAEPVNTRPNYDPYD